MELNEKQKNRVPWFMFLVTALIVVILFGGRVDPSIPGSLQWLFIVLAFFASLAGGIWFGFRQGNKQTN